MARHTLHQSPLRNAFTLIEIMIAISIIALLVGVSATAYSVYVRNARDARRLVDLESIRSALELYRSNDLNGSYPEDLEDLESAGFMDERPVDPLNDPTAGHVYDYEPDPIGCDNSMTFCTSYTLSVTLERNEEVYTITPTTPGGFSAPGGEDLQTL